MTTFNVADSDPMRLPRKALAEERGCSICDKWNDEMIALVAQDARFCRPCVTRVGRTILAANPAVVAQLWPTSPSDEEARRGGRPCTDINVEEALAAFKAGVAKQLGVDDAQSHLDLAVAYGEMGLMADAVREAAIALGERAPARIASQALNWIFARGRADADALPTIVRTLRSA